MPTKATLQKDIAILEKGLNNPSIPESNKATIRNQVQKLKAQLAALNTDQKPAKEKSATAIKQSIADKAKKYAAKPSVAKSSAKVTQPSTPPNITKPKAKRAGKSAQILNKRYGGKGKLNNRGAYQNEPQNPKYKPNLDATKSNRAKPAGWRYTNAGARRLKLSEGAEKGYVLKEHIKKYNGKYFKDANGKEHRYIYIERRADKSDIKRTKPYLEDGGDLFTLASGGYTNDHRHFNKAEPWEVAYNKKVGMRRKGYRKEDGGIANYPSYFGASNNINVFGYQTKYFANCPMATSEFEQAIQAINASSKQQDLMQQSLMKMAADVDAILKIEAEIVEGNQPSSISTVFGAITHYLIQIGIYGYRSGLNVNTSFMHNHVITIAEHLCHDETSSLAEPIFEDGGQISQRIEGDGDMLLSQLQSIEHHANELQSIVKADADVEPWVIAKMQRSATDLADVAHYLDYEEK